MPRVSTATPSGCLRPAFRVELPSQETNQISPCEADLRQNGIPVPSPVGPVVASDWSSGLNSDALESPRGTQPAAGQEARSSGLAALEIGTTS